MGHTEWTAHLNWDAGQVAHFHLTGLDRAALIALLKAQDERLAALADDPAFVAEFERVSEGDPLTCNLLIKALLGNTLSPTDLSRRPPVWKPFSATGSKPCAKNARRVPQSASYWRSAPSRMDR